MARYPKPRRISGLPQFFYFKPQGVPLRLLEEVIIYYDEFEAIRLYVVNEYEQKDAAKKMGISQPTFARILQRANKKIAQALVIGKAIRIEKMEKPS